MPTTAQICPPGTWDAQEPIRLPFAIAPHPIAPEANHHGVAGKVLTYRYFRALKGSMLWPVRYDFSPDALLHPETRIPFVEAESVPAFNPTVWAFDPANCWWLAGASHLAYHPAPHLGGALRRVGLRLDEVFEHAGTFGFIASERGFAILSFRGTKPDDLRDLLTDIDISLTTFGAGGRVHRGFLRALDHVWDAVDARIDVLERRGYRLWYTGHSLGAALATLAAARRPPTALVTFGSPLVGDVAFGRTLGALQVHRVVNCCDIIPTVPPEVVGYRHVGRQYFLTARGRLLVDPPSKRVFRSKVRGAARYATKLPWVRPGMVSLRSLADHTIINYAAGLHRTVKQWRTPQDPSIRAPSSTGRMP